MHSKCSSPKKLVFFTGGDIPNKVLRLRAGRGHCCLDLRSASFWLCLVLLHFSFLSDLSPFFYFVPIEFHSNQAQLGAPRCQCSFDFSCLSVFHFIILYFVPSSVLPGFQKSQSCITGHQSHLNDKYKNVSFCFCSGTTLLWHSKQNLQQTRRRTKRRWPCFSHLQGEPSQ